MRGLGRGDRRVSRRGLWAGGALRVARQLLPGPGPSWTQPQSGSCGGGTGRRGLPLSPGPQGSQRVCGGPAPPQAGP